MKNEVLETVCNAFAILAGLALCVGLVIGTAFNFMTFCGWCIVSAAVLLFVSLVLDMIQALKGF